MHRIGNTRAGTVLVEMTIEEWENLGILEAVGDELQETESGEQRKKQWLETEAFTLVRFLEFSYRPIYEAYLSGVLDGGRTQLQAIAEGRLQIQGMGLRECEVLREALGQEPV